MDNQFHIKDLRNEYFSTHGHMASDIDVIKDARRKGILMEGEIVEVDNKEWTRPTFEEAYTGDRKQNATKEKHNTDGGKTDFYDISGCKDVDDLAEFLDLRGDEFNCLKALVGIALERKKGVSRHNGTSSKRDAKKLLHYSTRIEKRIQDE